MKITLTFDNGPTPGVTDAVLDVLAERGVKATFFVVGEQLRQPGARALAERAAAEGHWIGNHTRTHTVVFGECDDPAAPADEIGITQDRIGGLSHPDRLFRPYGAGGILNDRLFSRDAVAYLRHGGYTCVLWNSIPHDWDRPDEWVDLCLDHARARDWTVTVIHDLPTGAMRHLPRLLDRLAEDGAEVVQDFPASCVPIRRGVLSGPIDHLTRA